MENSTTATEYHPISHNEKQLLMQMFMSVASSHTTYKAGKCKRLLLLINYFTHYSLLTTKSQSNFTPFCGSGVLYYSGYNALWKYLNRQGIPQ